MTASAISRILRENVGAARRGHSVSSLLAEQLRTLVGEDAASTAARKRAMALFATPIARAAAREVIASYGEWVREPTTVTTVRRATEVSEFAQLPFWVALIVAAAEQSGANILYSEDLNPGQAVVGVRIVNPFVGAPVG